VLDAEIHLFNPAVQFKPNGERRLELPICFVGRPTTAGTVRTQATNQFAGARRRTSSKKFSR
jgi:hypothetical protein